LQGDRLRPPPPDRGVAPDGAGRAHRRDPSAVVPVPPVLGVRPERPAASPVGAAPRGADGAREGTGRSLGRRVSIIATCKIALLPGEGIAKGVRPEAKKILQVVGKAPGASFEFEPALIGGVAIDATGGPLPPATLRLCKESNAILFGAVGGPKWDRAPQERRPERGLLAIRKELHLFANLRPAKRFPMPGDASPLKRSVVEGTDLMVTRELTGGLYFGEPRGREDLPDGSARAINTMSYTSREIERVVKAAFEVAMKRRKRLAS